MPIKATKIVELTDVAEAVNNRKYGTPITNKTIIGDKLVQPSMDFKERQKMSFFVINQQSDYLDHNKNT